MLRPFIGFLKPSQEIAFDFLNDGNYFPSAQNSAGDEIACKKFSYFQFFLEVYGFQVLFSFFILLSIHFHSFFRLFSFVVICPGMEVWIRL